MRRLEERLWRAVAVFAGVCDGGVRHGRHTFCRGSRPSKRWLMDTPSLSSSADLKSFDERSYSGPSGRRMTTFLPEDS